jgi:hypothetical protein
MPLHDRQPQARALAYRLRREERLEHPRHHLGRMPTPVSETGQAHSAARRLRCGWTSVPPRGIASRAFDRQVDQHLAQWPGSIVTGHASAVELDDQPNVLADQARSMLRLRAPRD